MMCSFKHAGQERLNPTRSYGYKPEIKANNLCAHTSPSLRLQLFLLVAEVKNVW